MNLPIVSGVEFKRVRRWPGYVVGSDGSVWSEKYGDWRRLKPTVLHVGTGYLYVQLYRNGHGKKVMVHDLVLTAFRGKRPRGMEACHGGSGSRDNSVGNLSWGTHLDNVRQSVAAGSHPHGETSGRCKLMAAEVAVIRALYSAGERRQRVLSMAFGVHQSTISDIVNMKSRRTG
jgi:hypothetical protein